MRRPVVASTLVVGIVVVAGGAALWLAYQDRPAVTAGPGAARTSARPTPKPSATAKPGTAPTPTTAPGPAPQPAGVPARPKTAQAMNVTYVYDGDTLQLQAAKPGPYVTSVAKVKVRLIGVDTPEMTPKRECFAQQATDKLRALARPGTTVWVAPDKDSWDDYRRRLFMVWTADGTLVDHLLVLGGYGRALRIYPNLTYATLYAQAEARARGAGRGIWSSC